MVECNASDHRYRHMGIITLPTRDAHHPSRCGDWGHWRHRNDITIMTRKGWKQDAKSRCVCGPNELTALMNMSNFRMEI
jgi:hypothetical protein